ncbi:oxygen-independent coproporphyrinogen III oxidase [Luteibacter sp. UNCMF366Tsu5.1]|uniref:oxygen-independent coproporphyrinogen III oxidase n=1 Tax=Luteibacter sp. UNCMF366Tsu5.1 TaxID=1502758 RepID=UPI0009312D77|nr:oxygen-independent coproporphyrinogen III oxidase [Luteibacter sp. UNCMF366Tsu5.1]
MQNAHTMPEFDADLIARYDGHGPRYTSYPSALQFHDRFGEADLREAITASNHDLVPTPLSLYVHVPFCESPCFYCGCNRVITRDTSRADDYLRVLDHEIAMMGALVDADRVVRQLHLGGGTPNYLSLNAMSQLNASIHQHFTPAPVDQREWGIEIDPRHANEIYVRGLARLGFNRVSIGIQDFDPAVQEAVNRVQSVEQTRVVIDTAKRAGYRSISVDLIYGLPRQTMDGFSRTLDKVIELKPDRIAVYGYAHLPKMFKAQRRLDAEALPSPSERLELFGMALRRLTEAGYVYVGMDHFALPDDDLVRAQRAGSLQRNFQGYSTCGDCDIIGLGPSAISRIGDTYSQNQRDLVTYAATVNEGRLPVARGLRLSPDDQLRREAIGELMCHGTLDMDAFAERHHIHFASYFRDALTHMQALADDGLVTLTEHRIDVCAKGRLLLRNIAMCFDAYAPAALSSSRLI